MGNVFAASTAANAKNNWRPRSSDVFVAGNGQLRMSWHLDRFDDELVQAVSVQESCKVQPGDRKTLALKCLGTWSDE
ncbi:MAG: hypothetical protein ACOVQL_13195, partial [Limnohabitans sp.]